MTHDPQSQAPLSQLRPACCLPSQPAPMQAMREERAAEGSEAGAVMAKLKTLAPRIATLAPRLGGAAKGTDSQRGNSTARGYGYRWQQARIGWLADHPLCVQCEAEGRLRVATEVDHVIPHRGDQALFWTRSNWQSLCKPCHSAKTARGE